MISRLAASPSSVLRLVLAMGFELLWAGCGAFDESSRDVRIGDQHGKDKPTVTQSELQQDVQRFTSEFMFRVSESAKPLQQSPDLVRRKTAMQRVLVYNATALDIATGPLPELNVVDMLVFVSLSRHVLQDHWLPKQFGAEGQPLLQAFLASEQDAWGITGKILSDAQQAQLGGLIEGWRSTHPDQRYVEGVRFREFSARAGEVGEERARRARGLFGQLKSATQSADQALLMGERALFLAHRLPFLVRLQARIGVQETIGDSMTQLGQLEALAAHAPEIQPVLHELTVLTGNATLAAREAHALLQAGGPYLELLSHNGAQPGDTTGARGKNLAEMLGKLDRISERSVTLLRDLRETLPTDPRAAADEIEARVDGLARRWLGYLLALGAGWSACFWGGYYVVKRLRA